MGLDQYAYCREDADGGYETNEEITYWRKHNRLQGWMEELWLTKREQEEKEKALEDRFIEALDKVEDEYADVFNGVELELDEHDLDSLENDIEERMLPETKGFFFGDDSYSYYDDDEGYKSTDLDFVEKAREALKAGKKVYYNSSW